MMPLNTHRRFLVVFLTLLSLNILLLVSSQVTYYITPTQQSPCDVASCYTLSEILSDNNRERYFSRNITNITVAFSSGLHILDTGVVLLEQLDILTLHGDSTSAPSIRSTIICKRSSGFVFKQISRLRIEDLAFSNCGSARFPMKTDSERQRFTCVLNHGFQLFSLAVVSVENCFLDNCRMEQNYNALLACVSSVSVRDSTFVNNTGGEGGEGGAIQIIGGNVVLTGSNLFQSNTAGSGGAVHVNSGELHCKGPVQFIANKATTGGALYVNSSRLNFHSLADGIGTVQMITIFFAQNSAEYIGGGIVLTNSTLVQLQSSVLTFVNNSAHSGGAIASDSSHLAFCGNTTCTNNSGLVGGAIASESSILEFHGSTTFTNNSVVKGAGGAIASNSSVLGFNGHTMFMTNSVMKGTGGSIDINSSWLEFNGRTMFTKNSVIDGFGGAIFSYRSFLDFYGNTTFTKNLVLIGAGGAMTNDECTLKFIGNTTIVKNSAPGGGGVLAAYTTLWFWGATFFLDNSAYEGGGISAWYYSNITFNTTAELVFSGNTAERNGGWLDMSKHSNLVINGTVNTVNNKAGVAGGAISVWEDYPNIAFKGEGRFLNNSAIFGGVIAIKQGNSTIDGKYFFEKNSADFGGGMFSTDGDIHLLGQNTFVQNFVNHTGYGGYGGAIHAMKTRLVICGQANFTGNSAGYGGGIAFGDYDNTGKRLYLRPNSSLRFENNFAYVHGGGILVEELSFLYCASHSHATLNLNTLCFFQLQENLKCSSRKLSSLTHPLNHYNIQMIFEANTAIQGGSDLYGGILDKCGICFANAESTGFGIDYSFEYIFGRDILREIVLEEINEKQLSLTSLPFRLCLCENVVPNCSITHISKSVHPGQAIRIAVVAVGQMNGTIPAVVRARFQSPKEGGLDNLLSTQPVNETCSPLFYTLRMKNSSNPELIIFAEGPCGELGYSISILVNFLQCPSGFALSQSGVCGCEHRLEKYTNSCDIDSRTVSRSSDFWVGHDSRSHGLILHPHCPFDYCTLETLSFTLNSTDQQCAHGRSGTLCGACKSGLSLNLGSSQCSSCSNTFLLLLLPFAAAGFLLVIFLFICKITVSAGTTSGLIFYANVIAVNRSVFFPPGETNILTVFIAWLNLDLGIEMCFFDGMDTYTRTWLQFVFPLYIWSLVGLTSLASHYSMTVARIIGPTNPVAVLATLFLLSYTKLLRTIIATFSFTTLDYPNDQKVPVWAYDGNIRFCEGKHAALFVAGLLAFLFVFLPYTLLLLCGQFIIARSNYRVLSWANRRTCKSFLDAYYAPYKNGYRYWTGLLLVLRFILFIVSAVVDINTPKDPSINLLALIITCIVLVVWIWNTGSMYRKWYCNALESSFFLNLAILAAASYQVKVEGGNKQAIVYTSMSVTFVTFLGIIAYHVIERARDSRAWKHSIKPAFTHLKERIWLHKENEDPIPMVPQPVVAPPKVTKTFVDLRETLLESQH